MCVPPPRPSWNRQEGSARTQRRPWSRPGACTPSQRLPRSRHPDCTPPKWPDVGPAGISSRQYVRRFHDRKPHAAKTAAIGSPRTRRPAKVFSLAFTETPNPACIQPLRRSDTPTLRRSDAPTLRRSDAPTAEGIIRGGQIHRAGRKTLIRMIVNLKCAPLPHPRSPRTAATSAAIWARRASRPGNFCSGRTKRRKETSRSRR